MANSLQIRNPRFEKIIWKYEKGGRNHINVLQKKKKKSKSLQIGEFDSFTEIMDVTNKIKIVCVNSTVPLLNEACIFFKKAKVKWTANHAVQ